MSRIIALDLGQKTIGICISDEMQMIAIPLENFRYEDYKIEDAIAKIELLQTQYKPDFFLIGYPTKTNGEKATITYYIDEIIEIIKNKKIKYKLIDERFSTQRAKELVDPKSKKFKEIKDVLAAYVLLYDYLLIK